MFKGQVRRLSVSLENGLAILGLGRVSVYEPRGTYQIIIEHLELKGRGDLQLAYEQLKQKLADEGLFDEVHKKQLPRLPRKIHVITSPSGAVIFDTISIIQRRFANIPIVIIPTAVQGVRATTEIVKAIDILNQQPDAEVAILARGGGSLEDLQAFNDELVARAIHGSHVPIISAIGHETDYTIADFVADHRAPTPSAAAERVIPERMALIERLQNIEHQLNLAVSATIGLKRRKLSDCRGRLVDPRRRIGDGRLMVDDLVQRMIISFQRTMRDDRRELILFSMRLVQNPLRTKIELAKQKYKEIYNKILNSINNTIKNKRWVSGDMVSRLQALDPLAVLERGYSITRLLPQRSIIKSSNQAAINDTVEITLASGSLQCRIQGKEDDG